MINKKDEGRVSTWRRRATTHGRGSGGAGRAIAVDREEEGNDYKLGGGRRRTAGEVESDGMRHGLKRRRLGDDDGSEGGGKRRQGPGGRWRLGFGD